LDGYATAHFGHQRGAVKKSQTTTELQKLKDAHQPMVNLQQGIPFV
jgi:hypothetical protein